MRYGLILLVLIFFIPPGLIAQEIKIGSKNTEPVSYKIYKLMKEFKEDMALFEKRMPLNDIRFFYRVHILELTTTSFEIGIFPCTYSKNLFNVNKKIKYTVQLNNDIFFISVNDSIQTGSLKLLPNLQAIDDTDTALIKRNIEFTAQKGLLTHFNFPLRIYKLKKENVLKEVIQSPLLRLEDVSNWKYLPFTNEAIEEFRKY